VVNRKEEIKIKEKILNKPDDESIISDIMDVYGKEIYYVIRRMVLTHEDADDIFQDVIIKVWLNIKNFRHESSLYTWIYRIAVNESLQFLKKKNMRSFENPNGDLQAGEVLKNDAYFKGSAIEIALFDAIQMLPEKQRLVFQMRYFDELSYEEISEITGTSVGALKANYHHALEKIETHLKSYSENIIIQ
jgi:RNA polymerase sigma-70 factor (ECF subfamily)